MSSGRMTSQAPIHAYCECMEEIKVRSRVIAPFISDAGDHATLGRDDFDYELIALNLRKILELIAFSSVMGNLGAYREAYADAERHWHAKRILSAVGKLNPDFFPIPVVIHPPDESGVKHLSERTADFLTKQEFEKLYDLCGSLLHVPNNISGKKKVINFIRHPGLWLMRIHNLLGTHYIKFVGSSDVWVVLLEGPADGKVHVLSATAAS